jgi:hypothetical protein
MKRIVPGFFPVISEISFPLCERRFLPDFPFLFFARWVITVLYLDDYRSTFMNNTVSQHLQVLLVPCRVCAVLLRVRRSKVRYGTDFCSNIVVAEAFRLCLDKRQV